MKTSMELRRWKRRKESNKSSQCHRHHQVRKRNRPAYLGSITRVQHWSTHDQTHSIIRHTPRLASTRLTITICSWSTPIFHPTKKCICTQGKLITGINSRCDRWGSNWEMIKAKCTATAMLIWAYQWTLSTYNKQEKQMPSWIGHLFKESHHLVHW